MPKGDLPITWFDLVVVVMVIVGLMRGRKRGMSQELLDLFMWLGMVAAGAFTYPISAAYLRSFGLSEVLANILAYVGAAAVVAFIFMLLKNALKDKIAGSDIFGRLEYPLGMLSGVVRFLCLLIMALALINAKEITKQERELAEKKQKEELGSSFFPSFGQIQQDIFEKSFCGKPAKEYLGILLIKPGSAKSEDLQKKDTLNKKKQLDEVTK